MPNKVRVLITGAGAPGAPGIIRCLQMDSKIDVIGCDADPSATGALLLQEFFVCPKAGAEFADHLIRECRRRNIQFVLPLVTRELPYLASAKKSFLDQGIQVAVAEPSALDLSNNKARLYQFLKEQNIEVPDFQVLPTSSSLGELEGIIHALGYPNRTVCIKPSVSNGSRGLRILDPAINPQDWFYGQKPDQSNVKWEWLRVQLEGVKLQETLVSEFLPGPEFSVDAYLQGGAILDMICRRRDQIRTGISVKGTFIWDGPVVEYATRVLQVLPVQGPLGIQIKLNASAQPRILECNPRLQGTTVSTLAVGVNFPLMCVRPKQDKIPENWFNLLKERGKERSRRYGNLKFARQWTEVFSK